MDNNKKTLLIFFGELRTFEHIIPHLKNLDKVDVMLSTWMVSNYDNNKFQVDENLIQSIYANIKYCNIIDYTQIENFELKDSCWKLFYHWKNCINNIKDSDEYDTIIFHRCDLLSNWHSILDIEVKDDTLYVHTDNYPVGYPVSNKNSYWINDYYFFGKFNIVKKFVNLLTDNKTEHFETSHFKIWETVSENHIKIENLVLNGSIIRNDITDVAQRFPVNLSRISLLTGPDRNSRI
jgi:hypothetical protein